MKPLYIFFRKHHTPKILKIALSSYQMENYTHFPKFLEIGITMQAHKETQSGKYRRRIPKVSNRYKIEQKILRNKKLRKKDQIMTPHSILPTNPNKKLLKANTKSIVYILVLFPYSLPFSFSILTFVFYRFTVLRVRTFGESFLEI